jgi:uncharacterized coiled-coil DUF342 family protein
MVTFKFQLWIALAAVMAWGQVIDNDVAWIIFLKQVSFAAGQEQGDARMKQSRAERLGLDLAELSTLDAAARTFETRESALREEALRYHEGLSKSGEKADPVRVRGFTDRRAALARDAALTIKSTLSTQRFTNLESKIAAIAEKVKVWK